MRYASTLKRLTRLDLTIRTLWRNTIVCAIFVPLCAPSAIYAATATIGKGESVDWPIYDGNSSGDHYSALSRINRSNVNQVKIAWRFDTGEGGLETNPLIIGKTLYAYTPKQNGVALDAETGRLKWKFDPGSVNQRLTASLGYCGNASEQLIRGLSSLPRRALCTRTSPGEADAWRTADGADVWAGFACDEKRRLGRCG
jgi:outer membrane protein assembly factor BamB